MKSIILATGVFLGQNGVEPTLLPAKSEVYSKSQKSVIEMILPELLSILPNSSVSSKTSSPDVVVVDPPKISTKEPADSPKIEFTDKNELPEGKLARSKRSGFLDAESLYRQAEMFMQPDGLKRFKHFYKQQIDSNDRYGC